MNQDEYFIEICKTISKKSKDPSTKVGALIVGPDKEIRSTGWNGFPRKVVDSIDRYENRSEKYELVAHGECNCICNAARVGTPLNGCVLYVYPFFPCNECAKMIIQCGITEVIAAIPQQVPDIWNKKSEISKMMFKEAGVTFRIIET